MEKYILTFDVGTTYVKAALHSWAEHSGTHIVDTLSESLELQINGSFAEQRPEDWWTTVCGLSRQIMERNSVRVDALGFCTQMLGLVGVDRNKKAVMNAVNYMDARVSEVHLLPHLGTILRSFLRDHVCSISEKDVVQKMVWIKDNQPDTYSETDKFLDVGDYLVMRATDNVNMSSDSAFLTFLYDHRRQRWDKRSVRSYGLDIDKLPDVVPVRSCKGVLSASAARDMGLQKDIPVYSGGDLTCIAYSTGLWPQGDLHMYWGTSGWVSFLTKRFLVHLPSSTTGLLSMQPGMYNFMGQMEISGKALDRMLSILGLDHADIDGLYERTAPGAGGLLCTPWIGGERTPFSDVNSRGCLTGISISTTSDDIFRAVAEGICLEYLWELNVITKLIRYDGPVVFVGGGSIRPDICQILSDVIGRTVMTHPDGRFCGNLGIAKLAAESIGIDASCIGLPKEQIVNYEPHGEYRSLYNQMLRKFKRLRKIK